ncbi:hypothetical protein Tco_0919386 [Tanacetum coccineum]
MGDENPIRTLGDYSKPSHEGYRNTIELPEGNYVVPLRSDTIRLVQNGCSFHGLRSEDPNQHLKDFLKLVDSLDLDVANRERTRLTSDRCLVELENQVQRLMEAHHALKKPVQVNKIASSCEICSGPHDTQYCMENPEQAFVEYASSRNNEVGDRHYQATLKRTLSEFDSHQERRLSSLGAQLERQQDDMINKINVLWKVFSEKFDDTSTCDTTGDSMAHVNTVTTDQIEKEELQSKGIKSPSKLLSLKYLSQASLEEQNRNPSSSKCVHFINFIVILSKKDEVREEENVNPNTTEYKDHEITAKVEEKVEEESEDEFEEDIEEEEDEEEDEVEYFDTFPSLEELRYHEWLLKYPKPSWVNAKIRTRSLNNVKFSCMIGHFVKKQDYIDLASPVNMMSRLHYNWIMSGRLEPRMKPSNPMKICNFVGRVRS